MLRWMSKPVWGYDPDALSVMFTLLKKLRSMSFRKDYRFPRFYVKGAKTIDATCHMSHKSHSTTWLEIITCEPTGLLKQLHGQADARSLPSINLL